MDVNILVCMQVRVQEMSNRLEVEVGRGGERRVYGSWSSVQNDYR